MKLKNGNMIIMNDEEDYDVVLDVLQKHHDKLWRMTESNMKMDMMNIMDDIRFDQMEQLKEAMNLWKNRNRLICNEL